ncbi:hypothetical protein V6Z11_A01G190800 [Gossypium hirsutum]
MVFSTVLTSVPNLYLTRKPKDIHIPIRCQSSPSVSISSQSNLTQFDLKAYWATLYAEITQKLEEAIPVKYPDQIYEAMRYSVLAKGAKRAPPVMCVAAYEIFGDNRLAAFPTACALEMVHAASLIHDDLPCMDDAPERRGQPSNHKVFGDDMAILAARTVGSSGMAAGQFLDLKGGNTVDFIQEKKYGAMGECSAVCGGLLAGARDDEIERLRRYGRAVGVLYEVVNDVLLSKLTEKEGTEGQEKKGKGYVSLYGIEKSMEIIEELRSKAKNELDGFEKYGDCVVPLYSFIDYAINRGFNVSDLSQ